MARGLYVIFYKTGEVYAGRYYHYASIGKKYFGSSSIAKQLKLQVAHIWKKEMPRGMSDEECAKQESLLINYVANKYGLSNLVFYRGDKDFFTRFDNNGRCINCHCENNSSIFPALQKARLDSQAMQLYGVPFHQVTEEMRKQRLKQVLAEYKKQNRLKISSYMRNYRFVNAVALSEKSKSYYFEHKEHTLKIVREYRKNNKDSISRNKRKYYSNHSQHIISYHSNLRDSARAIFGQSEYIDVNGKRKTISVTDIKAKHLRFEPLKEELKQFYDPNFDWSKVA